MADDFYIMQTNELLKKILKELEKISANTSRID